jgi:hypothetical protein
MVTMIIHPEGVSFGTGGNKGDNERFNTEFLV